MDLNKVWRKLFESYALGDRVRVKENSGWAYRGWEGEITKILISPLDKKPIFLVKSNRSREELKIYGDHHNRDPHLIGYFHFHHLELIEE